MLIYRCPKCGNYTYDETKPCPKCRFNFDNCEEPVITIENCLNYVVHYYFSNDDDCEYTISPNEIKELKFRENAILTLYFYPNEKDKLHRLYCHYFYNKTNYSDLLIVNDGDKYKLLI